jgi:hypothetical protein
MNPLLPGGKITSASMLLEAIARFASGLKTGGKSGENCCLNRATAPLIHVILISLSAISFFCVKSVCFALLKHIICRFYALNAPLPRVTSSLTSSLIRRKNPETLMDICSFDDILSGYKVNSAPIHAVTFAQQSIFREITCR